VKMGTWFRETKLCRIRPIKILIRMDSTLLMVQRSQHRLNPNLGQIQLIE
jgi:hypothetical protein